ncbi:hypothetical protein G647_06766 [Cladophialophora carrionii CBS 160.54]|uniref:Transcription factor domain-containing protein n=1 Tax=Cladophialophora carrionii CBS 160.54 TaxID=1279043 RepID=V9D736_9EURO|nr:uncharacterized protein G647_06766 [Cladophialophora carrionii CBS 160.54]ETI22690.1 hypothetical protein G647_06766 [Cladophialophora carrionii CBS 160.54]
MKLTWQRNHSADNKPPKVKAGISQAGTLDQPRDDSRARLSSNNREISNATTASREFKFVAGRPRKRRKKDHTAEDVVKLKYPFAVSEPGDPMSSESLQRSMSPSLSPTEFCSSLALARKTSSPLPEQAISAGIWQSALLESDTVPEVQNIHSPDTESLEHCLQIQQYTDSPGAWSQPTSGRTTDSWSETGYMSESEYAYQVTPSYIPQICFPTLHDKFSGLLNLYDVQFCKYPITNDFGVNPYRYRPETTQGSRHLLHAILAITSHFRLRSPTQPTPPAEALAHKNTAMVLYQCALTKTDLYNNGLSLLDTALALWQLEATISALNIWRSHLTDAYQLLELCGGPEKWSFNKRANVQVSMVLWWDAIVAMLARTECILPYTYLEAVLRHEGRQPWTFYELNGCPRELFVPMTQLANLSARRESKTATLLVSQIEQSVKRYEYAGAGSGFCPDSETETETDDEEAMHIERDKYHCCEGFRYALLIYILRVFTVARQNHDDRHQKLQATTQSRISFLSRVCLDHVAACRSTSLIQKQLLFPVFIAGCETRTLTHREFAAEYCRRWFRKFGYQMYMTVLDVMEAVWTEQDTGNEDFWWGDELDARRAKEGEFVQFCFG